jgi:hypothetical protein
MPGAYSARVDFTHVPLISASYAAPVGAVVPVLVIEDHDRMSQLLRRGLVEEGHAVDLAEDAENGEWLAGCSAPPAVRASRRFGARERIAVPLGDVDFIPSSYRRADRSLERTPIIGPIGRALARRRLPPLFLAVVVGACSSAASAPPAPRRSGHHHASNGAPAAPTLKIAPAYRLPAPVEREVAVAEGGIVYLAGGLDAGGASVAGVFSLDPATGKVTSLGSMPNAFHDAAGAMVDGRLVVFGGGPSTGTDIVQAFDPGSGTGSVIGHLPVALSDLQAASVGSTVYLIGGYDGTSPRDEIYATTDGRRFHVVAHLPNGVRYPAVTVLGSTILIAGGQTSVSEASADVFSFDTRAGTVHRIGGLPTPLAHASAFTLGDLAYVAGGRTASGSLLSNVSSIDPATGGVKRVTRLRKGVSDAATVQIEGSALLIGGNRASAVATVLRVDLESVRDRATS